MYNRKDIIFHTKTIECIKDSCPSPPKFQFYFYSTIYKFSNCDIDKLIDKLMHREIILFQAKIPRPYTIKDMLYAQQQLETLEFLETVKYKDHIVNARKLLHQYLHSRYNLAACNYAASIPIEHIEKEVDCRHHIKIGSQIYTIEKELYQSSPSKSIRNYLADYLTKKIDEKAHIQCGLFIKSDEKIEERCENIDIDKQKKRFYLPITEIPLFLLLFALYDGRDFSHSKYPEENTKLPHRNISSQISKQKYTNIIDQIMSLLKNNEKRSSPYTVGTIFRCNNILLFQKLNILLNYYNIYQSDEFINEIVSNYKFTYSETLNLKKNMLQNIFGDEEFIIKGLTSDYPDFMLFFDVLFRSEIIFTFQRTHSEFMQKIIQVKQETLQILQSDLQIDCTSPIEKHSQNGMLSIANCEHDLMNSLRKNNFFNNISCSTLDNLKQFCVSQNNDNEFLSFATISKALNITINQ